MTPHVETLAASLIAVAMTLGRPAHATSYHNAPDAVALRAAKAVTVLMIEGCILAATQIHRLPPAVLVILLNVEGGAIGRVSENTNGTVDIDPMQVNQIWLPRLAQHWHASVPDTVQALRDNFCANVEGGVWILRLALDEAHSDFWRGVAIYHSHDPGYQAAYLHLVLQQALHLEAHNEATQRAPTRLAARN